MFQKIKIFALGHKAISGFIFAAIIIISYFGIRSITSSGDSTRYALAQVEKGTIITSVSGTGQVSALNQLDVKPKVSGEITAIYITQGQEVASGALIAKIDTSEAERNLYDARTNLETAKLELDKLYDPVDELSLLQAENSLNQAYQSKKNSEDSLEKDYEDSLNTVANTFLQLPALMAGLDDMIFSTSLNVGQWNIDFYADSTKNYDEKVIAYKQDAYDSYRAARTAYDKNFADYKSVSRFSDKATIESLTNQTYNTVKDISQAVKDTNNLVQFYQDKLIEHGLRPASLSNTHLSSLNSYTSTTNSNLLSLLSTQRVIEDSKNAILNAEQSIKEKTLSLEKMKEGPDDLDVRAKKISIQQKEDALTAANETFNNHYVRVPFNGVIAAVLAKKGDSASSGNSLATIVTKQRIAEVSFNEIDVAKIKTGQKASLTFDAIEDLSLSGKVIEVDAIGTVNQGIVAYNVKISFDTQDERIKPGMSASVNIIIDVKTDVLMVPNAGVKYQDDSYYVQMPTDQTAKSLSTASVGIILSETPKNQPIEIGSANDDYTQIISGLQEGDIIITGKIASGTTSSAPTTSNRVQTDGGFRMPGF